MSSNVVDLRNKKPVKKQSRPIPIQRVGERRVSPIRMRRRRNRLVITAASFFLFTCVLALVSYVSYMPRFSVQAITVTGEKSIPEDVVRNYVDAIIHDGSRHYLSRANIFVYPSAVIERDLSKDFPRIASASVSRSDPFSNTVVVSITERESVALWCSQNTCYDMDKGGFIFSQDDATSSMYRFQGGVESSAEPIGQTFASGHLAGLMAFLDALGQAGFTAPGASVESEQDFTVPLAMGFPLKASFGSDAPTLVGNLKLVLQSEALAGKQGEIQYIDLRFGNRVYYKLMGTTAPTSASSTPSR